MKRFEPDYAATIRAECIYVRLLEAAAVLIELDEHEHICRNLGRMCRHN